MNIDGIIGFNSPSGTNKLIAAYGNDVVDVITGLGSGLNLTAGNKAQFEVFIDTIFLTNSVDKMRSYNNGAWSDSFSLPPSGLIPKYIKKAINNAQLLLANVSLTPAGGSTINYRSYVFLSNFATLGKNASGTAIAQSLQWGLEIGKCNIDRNTKQVHAIPDSNGRMPYFVTRGIKVGDPFFLLGGDIGQYSVASVDSEYQLTLNETIPTSTNTNVNFWVGRNWFQCGTDDNDQITGLGENSGRDLIFKVFSVWFFAATSSVYGTLQELKQIKGAPGTNSQRSIINDQQGLTYWFHGSDLEKTGIYRYDGSSVVKVSRAIDPFSQGMNAANFTEVVAWGEGDEVRFFLGDITNTSENISMTKAVATLNTITNAWDVASLNDTIKCATRYIQSNIQAAYCGTNTGLIMQMNTGNTQNGTPIPAVLETGIKYPAGSEIQNDYAAVQVISKNAKGVRISYKLWNAPDNPDDAWKPLGEINGDKTEFLADAKNDLSRRQGSGIQFRVEEDGSLANTWLIEKISVFYKPDTSRMV